MENANKQKRIFTVSFRNAPNLADDMYDDDESIFQMMEVTVTITPKKGDNNRSCVKWTIKVEKVNDNEEESGSIQFSSLQHSEAALPWLRW